MSWSRFCRVPLGGSVPDHSTLKKIAKRCGPEAIEGLNEALLEKAANNKVLKTDRVRADTTVVPGDVGYPTDSGLLARGVIRLVALVAALHVLGLATRTKMRDRSRSMRRRAHDIGAWLRRRTDMAKEEVDGHHRRDGRHRRGVPWRGTTGGGQRPAGPAPGRRRASGKAHATLAELEVLIERLERVVAQTRLRVDGEMPEAATPSGVACTTPTPGPSKKGRIGKPVEFGYLAQVVDNDDGIVRRPQRPCGQPGRRAAAGPGDREGQEALVGRAPRAVTADRGYGEAEVDSDLTALGVKLRGHRPQRTPERRPPGGRTSPPVPQARSNGVPAPKAGSRPSNATADGTAASWTASAAPKPGAATGSSPTTP